MATDVITHMRNRLIVAGVAVAAILGAGSAGYWLLVRPHPSLLDCLYMTVITVTTIGYGEVFDLSRHPAARVFTMVIAFSGIGTLTYVLSSATAFVVEGQLSHGFRRRNMEKRAAQLDGHYIVCGIGNVGRQIVDELISTHRPCVVVDNAPEQVARIAASHKDVIVIEGEGSDNETLAAAGIARAAGVFAATDDDNENIVITLTARQLNPNVAVVARCQDAKNSAKMKAAGARSVVSPTAIGAMRMASEMIRPTVVTFLDMMLRDKEMNLRVEEIPAPLAGRTVGSLNLDRFGSTLLLAVKNPAGWTYNPPSTLALAVDSVLVVMTTPAERPLVMEHVGSLKA